MRVSPADAIGKVMANVLTVSELTRRVRELLEGHIGEVWVEGEISNYRKRIKSRLRISASCPALYLFPPLEPSRAVRHQQATATLALFDSRSLF